MGVNIEAHQIFHAVVGETSADRVACVHVPYQIPMPSLRRNHQRIAPFFILLQQNLPNVGSVRFGDLLHEFQNQIVPPEIAKLMEEALAWGRNNYHLV
jgi:hypothetical protein